MASEFSNGVTESDILREKRDAFSEGWWAGAKWASEAMVGQGPEIKNPYSEKLDAMKSEAK